MNMLKDILYINPFQSHRLVTHEDGSFLHMHKLFGVLGLSHYIYRLYNLARYGTMFFDASYATLAWIGVHAMMHVTSFEFHLPQRRNKTYNIIWPEMRWHSLIFAYRSVLMMFVLWLSWRNVIPPHIAVYLRGPLVLLTMATADRVTAYYKEQGTLQNDETTMRSNPYPSYVSPTLSRAYNLFYSTSQVFGTVNILYRDMNAIFLVILPIQIAPLGMTLVKKGIINQAGWHLWYSLAIFANYWNAHVTPDDASVWYYKASVFLFCLYRFRFHINKYILWSFIIMLQWYLFATRPNIYEAVLAYSRGPM